LNSLGSVAFWILQKAAQTHVVDFL